MLNSGRVSEETEARGKKWGNGWSVFSREIPFVKLLELEDLYIYLATRKCIRDFMYLESLVLDGTWNRK